MTRVRKEIAKFGLTAEQLFGATASGKANKPKSGASKIPKTPKEPKYADGVGNTWGGMGKRPVWIHEALASGKTLEDLLVTRIGNTASNTGTVGKRVAKAKGATSAQPKAPARKRAAVKKVAARKPHAKASTKSSAN